MRNLRWPALPQACFALSTALPLAAAVGLYYGEPVRWALLAALAAVALVAAGWAYPRRAQRSTLATVLEGAFACAFGLSVAAGQSLQARGALLGDVRANLATLAMAAGFAAGAYLALTVLSAMARRFPLRRVACDRREARRAFLLALLPMLLLWLPVYLAFYPGVYAYDVHRQAEQCFTGLYDTQHPLLHTLFLQLGYLLGGTLGDVTLGVGMLTLLQLCLTALALSDGVAFLRRNGAPRALCFTATAYFSLLPVFPIMALSSTKDALFSAAFLLSLLSLESFLGSPRGSRAARAAAWRAGGWMALAMLLRNNALYAYAFAAAVGWLFFRKPGGWRLLRLCALAVLIALGGNALLGAALHAGSRTGVYEMLTIPAQQLRRAELQADDAADREAIAACFLRSVPAENGYQPTFGDIARYSLNTTVYGWNDPTVDIPVNPDQILRTWLTMAPRYPLAYLEAFLQTNRGSWFIGDRSHAEVYGPAGHGVGYLVTAFDDTSEWYPVTRRSLLPGLASALAALVSDNGYQRVPVLSQLLGTGFQVWVFFLGMLLCALRRRKRLLLAVCLAPLGLWLTLLMGPCTLVRYVYPFFMLNPLLLTLAALPPEPADAAAEAHPAG